MPRLAHALRLAAFAFVAALLVGAATAATARRPPVNVEATLDRQPQLLEQALEQVQPATGGDPRLYFVGFAGYGAEAVFKREVIAVRQLFDERFGTRGRSLALVNHASTLADIPLASPANLDRALRHLGKVMDTSRSTLFLFLTSHGEEGLLTVHMPHFRLQGLTPAQLKGMLDRARIENRVIVVSACHSGSFIPALAGPTSLIITAARADRTSFGCEDRRRWTYFGDAYFNRALRQDTSFVRAFERAKRLVRLWEAAEKLQPSLPQIAGGEALEPLLARFEPNN
jgi:hypothetical protein